MAIYILVIGLAFTVVQVLRGADLEDLSRKEKHQLNQQATEWIKAERQAQREHAQPLRAAELELYRPYFPEKILQQVRVRQVAQMPSPSFLSAIRTRGQQALSFERAVGLALDDTLLLKESELPIGSAARRHVLFHELVHVVQYELLDVDVFLHHYLESLIETGSYADIAFEKQAFDPQRRFRVESQPFSVQKEVEELIDRLQAKSPLPAQPD